MAHFRKDCISLLMTTSCNLSCNYCYLKNTVLPKQSIDLEFAKQGIQDFFAERASRHIRFFGSGEPTLEFEKMVELTNFAYGLAGNRLVIEVQTNGVFSQQIAKWLSKNANIVWISFDGPPEIQNILRPTVGRRNTANIIERNIKVLQEGGTNIQVGVRSTITQINLYRQIEMLDYFIKLGIRAVYSDPVFPPVSVNHRLLTDIAIGSDFNLEYAKQFLIARNYAEKAGVFYGSIFTVNFDEKTEIFCRSCLPSPHLTTDGYVSCCDMSYLGNTLPELIYGKYDTKTKTIFYDKSKISAIRSRRATNLTDCKGCEILYNCAGVCFGEGLNETGRLMGVKKDYCEAIRYLAHHLKLNNGLYEYLHP